MAQYAVSVYTTTPLAERADAVLRAIGQVDGVGTLSDPIKDMEAVSAGVLPDLTAFLPLWAKRLERFRPSKAEWGSHHGRWPLGSLVAAISRSVWKRRGAPSPPSLGLRATSLCGRRCSRSRPEEGCASARAVSEKIHPTTRLTDADRDAMVDGMRGQPRIESRAFSATPGGGTTAKPRCSWPPAWQPHRPGVVVS